MPSWFDIMKLPPIKRGELYPWFNRIAIETSAFCNRSCSFCPVSKHQLKQKLMDDTLFTSICEQLQGFTGCIELFLLNEPFFDPKYLERARELRDACPKANIATFTNGDRFVSGHVNLQQVKDAGINVLAFSIYDEGKDNMDFCKDLVNACVMSDPHQFAHADGKYKKHSRGQLHLEVSDQRTGRETTSLITLSWIERGISRPKTKPEGKCPRPMRHFIVKHDGIIPICCAVDPLDNRLPIMGSLHANTIEEIWNNEMFHTYRKRLQVGDRSLPGCNMCTARVSYPHVVQRVE